MLWYRRLLLYDILTYGLSYTCLYERPTDSLELRVVKLSVRSFSESYGVFLSTDRLTGTTRRKTLRPFVLRILWCVPVDRITTLDHNESVFDSVWMCGCVDVWMGGGERVDIRANIERKKVGTVLYVGSIGRDASHAG